MKENICECPRLKISLCIFSKSELGSLISSLHPIRELRIWEKLIRKIYLNLNKQEYTQGEKTQVLRLF